MVEVSITLHVKGGGNGVNEKHSSLTHSSIPSEMSLGKGCSLPKWYKVSITRKCVCGGMGENTLAYCAKTVNYTKASFVK